MLPIEREMEAERDYSRRILDTVAALHRDARRSRLTLVKKEAIGQAFSPPTHSPFQSRSNRPASTAVRKQEQGILASWHILRRCDFRTPSYLREESAILHGQHRVHGRRVKASSF